MAETSIPSWNISGDYFENCNCDVVCPCIFSPNAPFTATPTAGACEVAFAFHLDQGHYGDVALAGLNVALIARTPGPMADGDWSVALYVDERADEQQQAALSAIFSGAAGGTMGNFAPLIGTVLGVKTVPINWRRDGKHRAIEIPGVMRMAVAATPSVMGPDTEVIATNAHPFNPAGVVMAVGDKGSTWADYGMRWDNSGKNGHYAPITWSNG